MRWITLALLVLLATAPQVATVAQLSKAADPPQSAASSRPVDIAPGPPAPPITFADPDGQELILEQFTARTAIHGMLSLTELELRFRNPTARVIEGRFTCTLPENASISRFAKDVFGHLMEGEVVERLRANQVYEQFLHRMRDPALLEQDQGNRFSARIFPIEANAPVRLILSYTQLLPMRGGVRTYTLPLRGLPKVDRFSFRAIATPIPGERATGEMTTSTAEVTSFEERGWTPDRDVTMTWRASDTAPRILRAGDFYVASLRGRPTAATAQTRTTGWLFYIDTSASSAEGAAHRIRALESLLASLPASDRVEVLAFDNDVVPLMIGSAREVSRTLGERLRARLFLGGTDVAAMLRDVTTRLGRDGSRTVVIASDLVPTLGATASNEIHSAATALPRAARIHALILGSREDAPVARAVTAGRGRIVRVPFTDAMATRASEAASELQRPLGGTVEFADSGAEWLYPTRVEDVGAGDEVLVLGKVRAGQEIRVAQGAAELRLDSNYAPLLEREAYRAYLQYLAEREATEPSDAVRRALATEQVRISIEQRVVIPRTTLLVLESEFEYQRFGLDRRALADILTIDAGGIARVDRPAFNERGWIVPQGMPRPVATSPVVANEAAADALMTDASAAAPPPVARAPEAVQESITITAGAPMVEGSAVAGTIAATQEATNVDSLVVPPPPVEAPEAVDALQPSRATFAYEEPPAGSVEPAPAPPPGAAVAPRSSARRRPPMPPPAPPPPAGGKRGEEQEWTRVTRPPKSRIAELEEQLRRDPRDRELYNQLGEVLVAHEEWSSLRALALRWQPFDPENPQVYELLGMSAVERDDDAEAARAFASLIELAPAKTELLQRAGMLLLRTRRGALAERPLRKALEARPDRANGYRNLALMLWQQGRHDEAASVLESATRQNFPNWYLNVQRVIREELGYVYRAWLRRDPSRANDIRDRAREYNVDLERRDALRVTLVWETDANDVDLHVVDPRGEECYYANPSTKSGLALYEDITQGLGPEVIRGSRVQPGTYHVGVRYFAAGPMGISRGMVVVLNEDGTSFEVHPFRLTKGGGDIRYVTAVRRK